MTRTHPREGTEFDWIAADIDGKIALMSTAGYGNCPTNESEWMERMDNLVERILAFSEPPTNDLLTTRTVKGPIIYDWQHWQGPYMRIHIPGFIIETSELTAIGIETEMLPRIQCRFVETEKISDDKIVK